MILALIHVGILELFWSCDDVVLQFLIQVRWINLPQILLLARKVVAVERFMGLTAQEVEILVPRQYLW